MIVAKYLFSISGLKRNMNPFLDLDVTVTKPELSSFQRVAALPIGEAVVYNYIRNNKTRQVLRLDSQGKIKNNIYSCVLCSGIGGLLVLDKYLYIIHNNGTVIKTLVSDGHVMNVTNIPDVSFVINSGSLYSKPEKIPDKQTLLLCDYYQDEVFTFKPSTGQKKVRITGLSYPRSVSYLLYNNNIFNVCDSGNQSITVYNNTWDLMRTIGRTLSGDGELNRPMSVNVSDEDTIFLADIFNGGVLEFSFNGTFLRYLLGVHSDCIHHPESLSYYYPHLWLIHGSYPHYKLYRYNLYG